MRGLLARPLVAGGVSDVTPVLTSVTVIDGFMSRHTVILLSPLHIDGMLIVSVVIATAALGGETDTELAGGLYSKGDRKSVV